MGKGDKRSKKGKIFAGSFGKSRPKLSTIHAKKRKEELESGTGEAKQNTVKKQITATKKTENTGTASKSTVTRQKTTTKKSTKDKGKESPKKKR